MFVLWGSLEEKKLAEVEMEGVEGEAAAAAAAAQKDAGPVNLPFECCIMEYGIESHEEEDEEMLQGDLPCPPGWRRMFALFGATRWT